MTEITINEVKNIVSVLTQDQQQLLKDTIRYGSWGDSEYTFLNDNGEEEERWSDVYITNDAKKGGHFSGRQISAMFRSIYSKICLGDRNRVGEYISHASDWWGDGSGDVLFIKEDYVAAFEELARS